MTPRNSQQNEAPPATSRCVCLRDLLKHSWRIPPEQREWCWGSKKACRLFNTLFMAYKLRPGDKICLNGIISTKGEAKNANGVYDILLYDGQQRLFCLRIILIIVANHILAHRNDITSTETEILKNHQCEEITMSDKSKVSLLTVIENPNDLAYHSKENPTSIKLHKAYIKLSEQYNEFRMKYPQDFKTPAVFYNFLLNNIWFTETIANNNDTANQMFFSANAFTPLVFTLSQRLRTLFINLEGKLQSKLKKDSRRMMDRFDDLVKKKLKREFKMRENSVDKLLQEALEYFCWFDTSDNDIYSDALERFENHVSCRYIKSELGVARFTPHILSDIWEKLEKICLAIANFIYLPAEDLLPSDNSSYYQVKAKIKFMELCPEKFGHWRMLFVILFWSCKLIDYSMRLACMQLIERYILLSTSVNFEVPFVVAREIHEQAHESVKGLDNKQLNDVKKLKDIKAKFQQKIEAILLRELFVTKDECAKGIKALFANDVYNSMTRQDQKYLLLLGWSDGESGGEKSLCDSYEIEHLRAQTPVSISKQRYQAEASPDAVKSSQNEDSSVYLHSLRNLIIMETSVNRGYGNSPFPEKRDYAFKRKFSLSNKLGLRFAWNNAFSLNSENHYHECEWDINSPGGNGSHLRRDQIVCIIKEKFNICYESTKQHARVDTFWANVKDKIQLIEEMQDEKTRDQFIAEFISTFTNIKSIPKNVHELKSGEMSLYTFSDEIKDAVINKFHRSSEKFQNAIRLNILQCIAIVEVNAASTEQIFWSCVFFCLSSENSILRRNAIETLKTRFKPRTTTKRVDFRNPKWKRFKTELGLKHPNMKEDIIRDVLEYITEFDSNPVSNEQLKEAVKDKYMGIQEAFLILGEYFVYFPRGAVDALDASSQEEEDISSNDDVRKHESVKILSDLATRLQNIEPSAFYPKSPNI